MNEQQQINPVHIEALVQSLNQQIQGLSMQLADTKGYVAVLEAELKKVTSQQSEDVAPEEAEVVN